MIPVAFPARTSQVSAINFLEIRSLQNLLRRLQKILPTSDDVDLFARDGGMGTAYRTSPAACGRSSSPLGGRCAVVPGRLLGPGPGLPGGRLFLLDGVHAAGLRCAVDVVRGHRAGGDVADQDARCAVG